MIDEEIIQTYDITEEELKELYEFCEEYILGYDFNIIDLINYDDLLTENTKEIEKLKKSGIIKTTYNFINIVNSLSKDFILNLIPLDSNISKNTSSADLKTIITNNKSIYEKYFNNFVFVSLNETIYDYLYNFEDFLEEYKEETTPKNKENTKYKQYYYSHERLNIKKNK